MSETADSTCHSRPSALTVIAGLLGVRVVPFLLLVGTGKGLRYLFVTLTTLGIVGASG